MFIKILRRNIGTIVAAIGFFLLCILTFGNLGEIATAQYWANVRENLTSIGFMSVSLTIIQVVVKQGISEQGLQRGLNSDQTTKKYEEHRSLIKACAGKMLYLPYFLQIYNDRNTLLKKREFLVNNGYVSEKSLLASGKKRLIREYKRIRVSLTTSRIKWATTDIVHNRYGQIMTLSEYRTKRIIHAVITSLLLMVGVSFLARGLFFTSSGEPLWQKFVKLLSYVLAIAIGSLTEVVKSYEKGAFGVPNELEEINEIWREFQAWPIPEWIKQEVENISNDSKEVSADGKGKEGTDGRTDIPTKQTEGEGIRGVGPGHEVAVPVPRSPVLSVDGEKLDREHNGNTASA